MTFGILRDKPKSAYNLYLKKMSCANAQNLDDIYAVKKFTFVKEVDARILTELQYHYIDAHSNQIHQIIV